MESLTNLREQLKDLTQQYFQLINFRKALVAKIQKTKPQDKKYFAFDPFQEKQIFKLQKEHLQNMSPRELLAYSLIMEEHASVTINAYPQWSQGEHISGQNMDLLSYVNPILLAVVHKEKYDELPLNEQFKNILESHV